MIRECRWMVRFSPVMGERVRMRAADQGMSIAEYLRTTIETDLKKGGLADALAQLNMEVTLVTGMMVREMLSKHFNREEARNLEDWANERATGIIKGELQERAESA